MISLRTLLRGFVVAIGLVLLTPMAGIELAALGIGAAQAQTVTRIDVFGNEVVDDATVIQYLSIRVGEAATPTQIAASTNALHATGLFRTVNVGLRGSILEVRVTENAIIASVLFEGNVRFTDEELLAMVSVGSRGVYTPERLTTDTESIRQAYLEAGFTDVVVDSRTEPVAGGRLRVIFAVSEGGRVGVAAINFTGNNAFTAGQLKDILLTKESGLLSWLFQDDIFSEDKLAVDRERLRLFHADNGFPDVQVSSVAEFDAERRAYFVSFTIVEGERYTFGDIGIDTSIAGLNTDALTGAIRTNEGAVFNQSLVQRTSEDLAIRATEQGHAFADVRPRLDRDIARRVFNVTYLVDDGARVYVERIEITGNVKTRDFVIRREVPFIEGDPFNRSLLTRAKSNIERLGYFATVNVGVTGGSAPDRVVVGIAVVERSTGEYGFSAGYSTGQGILGEVTLVERNFLGRGQFLRIALGASATGRNVDFSFTEPRFMGLRVATGVDLYYRSVSEMADNLFYGYEAFGGQGRVGLPITDDLTIQFNGGAEHKVFHDIATPFSGLVMDGDQFNKAFAGYTLTYNTLNHPSDPNQGLIAVLTQQYVGWDHNYLKSEARARYFMPVPILDQFGVVASVKGSAGVINDFSGDGVHPTEAFYKGNELVRGFAPFGVGPRTTAGEAVGSTAYAGGSAEVEVPVPFLSDFGFSAAGWVDVGWLGGIPGEGLPIDPLSVDFEIRSTYGFSIIWDGLLGPLRTDFAFPIVKATADEAQPFSISVHSLL